MSIITVSKLNKYYGIKPVLTDVSFHINKGDRIGVVGANGAGKSTLIKILAGELNEDSGEVHTEKNLETGYLKQRDHFPEGGSVREEMLKYSGKFKLPEGADPEKWMMGTLKSLAFTEDYLDKSVNLLSGGERTRLALAALLLQQPDFLLLDEPTNHLDIGSLKWLEQYLKSYRGSFVVISHDRYFLDKTVNRIFEVELSRLTCYDGNYTAYKEKKRLRFEEELRHYENTMAEVKRQEAMIRIMKEHNTEHLVKRAQSREKRLAMMDIPDKPLEYKENIRMRFDTKLESGIDVLKAENLSKRFGDRQLFSGVDLDIKKGDRICMVGPNGIGKTTLLKILLKELSSDSGYLSWGQNVIPAYYDQEQRLLNPANTVLEELHSSYIKYNQTELRSLLGRFMFYGDDVFKTVADLAGGEKAKLSLLKLMMSGANLLVLDEPTNHLDIKAKEVFEDALLEFPGTLIIVSHDRYLLKKVPTAIYELCTDGIKVYLGNYDYYEEKSGAVTSGKAYMETMARANVSFQSVVNIAAAGMAKEERIALRKQEREEAAAKRKAEKQLLAAEQAVNDAENRVGEIEKLLCTPEIFQNPSRAAELSEMLTAAKENLDKKYEEWIALQ